jgi:hypothetical protein
MRRHACWSVLLLASVPVTCTSSRKPPPEPDEEAVKSPPPACEKVFRDPAMRGAGCCSGPSAAVLKKADVLAACGRVETEYAGETRDGGECRFHFHLDGVDPKDAFVAINRPLIPPGSPAPTEPDPLLPWTWKKVPLKNALAFMVRDAPKHPELLERQYTLWAGRGRRIVGMKIAKKVCTESQALALLQKAIDGEP